MATFILDPRRERQLQGGSNPHPFSKHCGQHQCFVTCLPFVLDPGISEESAAMFLQLASACVATPLVSRDLCPNHLGFQPRSGSRSLTEAGTWPRQLPPRVPQTAGLLGPAACQAPGTYVILRISCFHWHIRTLAKTAGTRQASDFTKNYLRTLSLFDLQVLMLQQLAAVLL